MSRAPIVHGPRDVPELRLWLVELSHGTGYPVYFKCSAQRREAWRYLDARNGHLLDRFNPEPKHDVERTGRTKRAPSPGKGHPRKLFESHEYVCSCGHVGWTCHVDILRRPLSERA